MRAEVGRGEETEPVAFLRLLEQRQAPLRLRVENHGGR